MKFLTTALFASTLLFAASAGAQVAPAGDCPTGSVSIRHLAQGTCGDRIPVPTARPTEDTASQKADRVAASRSDWDYVRTADASGEMREVRIVGPRFLPDAESQIDLRQIGEARLDAINAAVVATVRFLGPATAQAAEAEAEPVEQVSEARVDEIIEARVPMAVIGSPQAQF